jgi:hypothetical protein
MTWHQEISLMRKSLCLLIALLLGIVPTLARAEVFGGIDFPNGASSFADSVIQWNPLFSGGPGPTNPNFANPDSSLGVPDFPPGGGQSDTGAVSLGHGGLLELAFTDNLLTNSGNSDFDLYIFEIGIQVEDTFVAVRPTTATLALLNPAMDSNGDGFFEIGKVFGSTSSIDIDSLFSGFVAGELEFDAVQLIDDLNEGGSSGGSPGADIDAVGAIASVLVPEPSTTAMLATATMLLGVVRRRGRTIFQS